MISLANATYGTFKDVPAVQDGIPPDDYLKYVMSLRGEVTYSVVSNSEEIVYSTDLVTELGSCFSYNSEIAPYSKYKSVEEYNIYVTLLNAFKNNKEMNRRAPALSEDVKTTRRLFLFQVLDGRQHVYNPGLGRRISYARRRGRLHPSVRFQHLVHGKNIRARIHILMCIIGGFTATACRASGLPLRFSERAGVDGSIEFQSKMVSTVNFFLKTRILWIVIKIFLKKKMCLYI